MPETADKPRAAHAFSAGRIVLAMVLLGILGSSLTAAAAMFALSSMDAY